MIQARSYRYSVLNYYLNENLFKLMKCFLSSSLLCSEPRWVICGRWACDWLKVERDRGIGGNPDVPSWIKI